MLTADKLRIYKQFNGDVDFFGRTVNEELKTRIYEDDFYLIESIVQDYHLIANGFASEQYTSEFVKRMETLCATAELSDILHELKQIQDGH